LALVEIGRATEIDGTHPTRTKRDLLVEYAERVRVESNEFMNLTLKGRDFLRTYLASQ
jgi:hypothetical protein